MERNPPPKPKTYSDVMNEWAAQRDFIGQTRSRILHPAYNDPLPLKIIGYFWRVALVVLLPATVFMLLVRYYGKSTQFNKDLEPVVLRHLGAAEGETTGFNWQLDGRLNARAVEAKGGPHSFFHELEARTITSSLPASGIFKKAWLIPSVDINNLSIILRTGAIGDIPVYESADDQEALEMKPFQRNLSLPAPSLESLDKSSPGDPPQDVKKPEAGDDSLTVPSLLDDPPPPDGNEGAGINAPASAETLALMRGGYGINPDPASIRVLHYRGAEVDLRWGGAPVTSGALLNTIAELDRNPSGWSLTANGGSFRQGWLQGLTLDKLKADITETQMEMRESRFTQPGGTGSVELLGTVTFGDLPEVKGTVSLRGVPLHRFIAEALGNFFQAQVTGDLALSGSMNRSTGVETTGTLALEGGRISGLPVQRALQLITGEDQVLQLPVKSGGITLKTHGDEVTGALVVEITDLEADCGALAKVRATARYEQLPPGAAPQNGSPKEAPRTAPGGKKPPLGPPSSGFMLTGELRIGLASYAMRKVSPAIVAKFFTKDEAGGDWHWITVPLTDQPEQLSVDLAEQLIQMHNEESNIQ